MNDLVRLSCPACGGKLELNSRIDRFACAHCGTEHVVSRGGGIVSLQPVTEGLQRIQTGTDRTAAELALQRLRVERSELHSAETMIKEQIETVAGELVEWERLGEQARRSASQARRDGAILLGVAALNVVATVFISELRALCLIVAIVFLAVGIAKIAESRNPRAGNQAKTSLTQIVERMQQLEQQLSTNQKDLQAVHEQIQHNHAEMGEQRKRTGVG